MKEFAGKHILMIVENLSVPFDRRVWREALALHKAGAAVSVICPRGMKYDSLAFEEIDGVQIHRYRLNIEGIAATTQFSRKIFILEYLIAFIHTFFIAVKIYVKRPFHVIHAANPPDIFFVLGLLFKPFGVKYIFDHHDLCPEAYLDKQNVPIEDFLYKAQLILEKLSFVTSSIVISTNESYRRIALTRGKKKSPQVFVVRNGPDANRYEKVSPDPFLHNGYQYLVGYIGVMAKLDGVDYLIRAADYIVNKSNRKDIGFILIGSGTSITELKQLTRQLNLGDYVQFTGRIPDEQVFSILSTIDIGAAPDPPSHMNNVSTMNKIMDYMWFGKPIVSFDLFESKRTAQEAALYVQSPLPESFGQGILDLMDSPEKRQWMGRVGKERVQTLTWQQSEKNLIKAYHTLCCN